MRAKLYLVYFNVSLFCVLLIGLEMAGQAAFWLWKGYPVYESDQHLISEENGAVFELHPYLVGRLRGDARFEHDGLVITTTPNHTRWTGADPVDTGAVRIAVVGGSTTFGSGATDSASWPARLQALLGPGYAVINFGMPGFSTAEAVIQMALEVPEARPDIVVFFEGWNDLHNFHDASLGPDYYSHGMRQYSNLNIEPPKPTGLFAKLVEVSAVVRLAAVVADWRAPAQDGDHAPARASLESLRSDPDSFVERIYRRNLGTLHFLTGQIGAYSLFVPQIMNPSRLANDSSSRWTPQLRNAAVPALIGEMNGILAGACDGDHARCAIFDAGAARSWEPADFIDEGHFSTQGNDAFARLIADWLADAVGRQAIPGGGTARR